MAGKERGMVLIPEVGDEVLMGFEREDLHFPYVLGALWNGKERPPLANGDGKNDKRILMSRKKHYLLFDDGDKGVVELAHENGALVRFTDDEIVLKDNQGNQLKIANQTGAMSVESNGQLNIKATTITIEASGTLTVKAGATLTITWRPGQHQLKDTTMGQPAARFGDSTSHGTPLAPGPGCPTVLIGGQPAWRATSDVHACPLVDGAKPHVGGVVAMGSVTVMIGGLPAARQGDMVVEAGAPNAIVGGAPTVLIG